MAWTLKGQRQKIIFSHLRYGEHMTTAPPKKCHQLNFDLEL